MEGGWGGERTIDERCTFAQSGAIGSAVLLSCSVRVCGGEVCVYAGSFALSMSVCVRVCD